MGLFIQKISHSQFIQLKINIIIRTSKAKDSSKFIPSMQMYHDIKVRIIFLAGTIDGKFFSNSYIMFSHIINRASNTNVYI